MDSSKHFKDIIEQQLKRIEALKNAPALRISYLKFQSDFYLLSQ